MYIIVFAAIAVVEGTDCEPEPEPECGDAPYSCVGLDDGTQDIYLGATTPITVTCEDGWIALELQPQENADNGWMVSYDTAGNDWSKCGCSQTFADESLAGLTG